MEFNEKLQELRKQKGMTQEELAAVLYVSRTAVSKWESGRGYPGIDSLKDIANFFSVSIDDLLSSNETLILAEQDSKQLQNRLRTLVFGLLDVSVMLFLFLPFFGQKSGEIIEPVSLLMIVGVSTLFRIISFSVSFSVVLWGVVTLAFQNLNFVFFEKFKFRVSLFLNTCAVLFFIVSPNQTYASAYLFVLLIIKALILVKRQ